MQVTGLSVRLQSQSVAQPDEDIRWAHLILVTEEKHRSGLVAEFTRLVADKRIHVLDIPDDDKYMDPELVEELKQAVEPFQSE